MVDRAVSTVQGSDWCLSRLGRAGKGKDGLFLQY
jgi:hypothetical protein